MEAAVAVGESFGHGAIEMNLPIGRLATALESERTSGNVRAVAFIAKPQKIDELKSCIDGPLANLLRRTDGFDRAIVLQSHRECRSILVLTFWGTKVEAVKNCWEEFPSVREMISPLIDVCKKVQTFQATIALSSAGAQDRDAVGA